MANYQYMMSADDVARELNCSKSHAYKLVKSMNEELASQGYITMAGRIPRAYWAKKMYGYELSVGQEILIGQLISFVLVMSFYKKRAQLGKCQVAGFRAWIIKKFEVNSWLIICFLYRQNGHVGFSACFFYLKIFLNTSCKLKKGVLISI